MDLARRLTLQLAATLTVPAIGAAYAATHLFPDDPGQADALPAVAAVSLLVMLAGALRFWRLLAPLRTGLAEGASPAARRLAADAALAIPARLAGGVGLLAGGGLGAVLLARLARGRPADVAIASSAAAAAFCVMAAMLAYSVASAGLAGAIAALGPGSDQPIRGSMRGRVLLVASGLLAFALLLLVPVAYGRYRTDLDRHWVGGAERILHDAARQASIRTPAELVDLVAFGAAVPAALLAPDGSVLAATGGLPGPAASPRGPARELVPGGWRLRVPLATGATLVAFVPEAPLLARRAAFWGSSGLFGLGVLAAASLLVWLVARSFTVPLRFLGRAADRVASGDLRAQPPSVTQDEIGQLAADFRRMTDGLAALIRDVQEANRGVLDATGELAEIGGRVRAGAAEERTQLGGVRGEVAAMQDSVALATRSMGALREDAALTRLALVELHAAQEAVRRPAAELEALADAAGKDAELLSETGRRAQAQLGGLEELAGRAGGSVAAVSDSLESLENQAVASQLAAAQAAELADHAGVVVREAAEGIEGVRAAVADAKGRVSELNRRSDDIDRILVFINEVAGRTNLLSLNASIIATQAGEHGRAFAVVSEQIRALASQISSSTQSIGEIIRSVRGDVEGTALLIDRGDALAAGGVALAGKSLRALEEIRTATARGHEAAAAIQGTLSAHAASTRDVSALVASVAAASKALAEAVQQVGRSAAGVRSVTRGVNGLADRVAQALTDQQGLGRRQLESLERSERMLSDATGAMERHGDATRAVEEALRRLAGTAHAQEAAVGALGGVAGRLGAHSRALAERLLRFKLRG